MENYFVYSIKSSKDGRMYVGISKDPDKRLREHNNGDTKSTKFYRPWALIYKQFVGSRIEARRIEKKLKSGYGKEFLKHIPAPAYRQVGSAMVESRPDAIKEMVKMLKKREPLSSAVAQW